MVLCMGYKLSTFTGFRHLQPCDFDNCDHCDPATIATAKDVVSFIIINIRIQIIYIALLYRLFVTTFV